MKIFSSVGDGDHYFEGTLDGNSKTLDVYFNMKYIFYTVPFGKVQGMQLVDYNGEEYKKAVKQAKNLKVTAFKAKAGKGRKAAASWKKNKKADGYQIAWSTSKKFTKKTTKTRLISKNKATKATSDILPPLRLTPLNWSFKFG